MVGHDQAANVARAVHDAHASPVPGGLAALAIVVLVAALRHPDTAAVPDGRRGRQAGPVGGRHAAPVGGRIVAGAVDRPRPGDTWAKAVVADEPIAATLVATQAGPGGVATTTAFRLTSLDGTAPEALAARLHVEPPVTLAVASVDGASAVVRPAAPLQPRTLYRIALVRADGSTQAGWAAQTAGPLRVVESIPGDQATAVPVDTGIELRFDQAGVAAADLERHLVIEPATSGRLETAGRVTAFVPSKPLRAGTLYTVTVTRGLPLAGTDQRLEHDAVVRFETASSAAPAVHVGFRRSFVESATGDRPSLGIWVDIPGFDGDPADFKDFPTAVPVTVSRLPGLRAAEAAWATLADAPTWSRADTDPAVDTAGLPRLVDATIRLRGSARAPGSRCRAAFRRAGTSSRLRWAASPARPSSRSPTSPPTPSPAWIARPSGSTTSPRRARSAAPR